MLPQPHGTTSTDQSIIGHTYLQRSQDAERQQQAKSDAEEVQENLRSLWDIVLDQGSTGTGLGTDSARLRNQSGGDQFSRRLSRSETVAEERHSTTSQFVSGWRSSSQSATPVAQGQNNLDTVSSGRNQGRSSSSVNWRSSSTSTTPVPQEQSNPDEFSFGRNQGRSSSAVNWRPSSVSTTPAAQGQDNPDTFLFGRNPGAQQGQRNNPERNKWAW